ncbi:hypothetical protein V6N11_044543, partial [Hibiscus sabdariffa]
MGLRVRATTSSSSPRMDASGTDSDAYGGSSSNSRRHRILSASNII